MAISIHAPTRGATMRIGATQVVVTFQSTLPQGERRDSGAHGTRLRNFNPRSHKGSDHKLRTKFFSMPISIHAPTRGATLVADAVNQAVSISIHAPTRGATTKVSVIDDNNLFQSTLPQGERQMTAARLQSLMRFQSTLPQGERPGLSTLSTY